jgi:indolepyruvate ferredoxin oxidoreductase beta subunit
MSDGAGAIERPIKLCVAALGGQGGGVLATWLIQVAEAEGFLAQSTSVPGVAQRTGATIYYLEFFPRAVAERVGREPVMALMPVSGDVDCVVASELVEAGRALQRGLVTPDRTTLIASSHRSYTIAERSAMGDGAIDTAELTDIVRAQARRMILFDMDAMAQKHHSVISSVMLGALCGSGVLPFARKTFEQVIRQSGIAVETNLAAFGDACGCAEGGAADQRAPARGAGKGVTSQAAGAPGAAAKSGGADTAATGIIPAHARTPALQPLLERVRKFDAAVQSLVFEGVKRTVDYQDPTYAALYLDRLERIAALDGQRRVRDDAGATNAAQKQPVSPALTEAVARSLALWMTFEDTLRVADLKTRRSRFARVREDVCADPGQLFGITEFMKPRVAEIAGTMPAGLGRWMLRSPGFSRFLARLTNGKQVRTSTISGFMLLHTLGGLRRWRRGTLRYQEENARIERWLERIAALAVNHSALAAELARAQRLVKGYGDTHERGWRNFCALVDRLDALAARADGAEVLARLQTAALADEEGTALARELATMPASAASPRS